MLTRTALAALLIFLPVPALAQERFPDIPVDRQSPAQRDAIEKIVTSPRKSMRGPFNAWIRNPELATRVADVGRYLRFESPLPARLREFVILATARFWGAQFEWYAHYPLAVEAGLPTAVIEDMRAGRIPAGMRADERIAYEMIAELRRDHRLSDATFAKAKSVLGESALVEVVVLAGYYDLVAMTLLAADVQAPGDEQPLPRIADRGK